MSTAKPRRLEEGLTKRSPRTPVDNTEITQDNPGCRDRLKLDLKEVEEMTAKPVDESKLLDRITIDPDICHGKPCIRGLRYPVEMILELLSGGMTHQELLADYDDLEPDDILAVLAYAARLTQMKRVHAVLR